MDDIERLARARAIAAGAGRSQEHLRFALEYLDTMTGRAVEAETNVDFLMAHSGASQIAALEKRCQALHAELTAGQEIIRRAREWGQAIVNLEQARKKPNDGEKKKSGESVYKANQAYTAAQLALKTHLALTAVLKSQEEAAITET